MKDSKHSIKPFVIAALSAALLGGAVFLHFLFNGPHMRYQENLRANDWSVPPPPSGSVPVEPHPALPSGSAVFTESVSDYALGQRDYEYFCIFCHGANGDGNGPVGQSYIPRPANLRTPRVQALNDAELLRRSLTGTGHAPVLEQVIPSSDWSSLVAYVRHFGVRG